MHKFFTGMLMIIRGKTSSHIEKIKTMKLLQNSFDLVTRNEVAVMQSHRIIKIILDEYV